MIIGLLNAPSTKYYHQDILFIESVSEHYEKAAFKQISVIVNYIRTRPGSPFNGRPYTITALAS